AQPLTQGPITVYDDGVYAGETRTLDLQPGEERLLSYALDLGTEVKADAKTAPGPHLTLRIGGNHLTARYKARQTTAYGVKNRSPHARALVIEHPIRRDWELVAPARPAERSRDVYRFRVPVAAGQSARFEVAEEQARVDERELQNGKEPYYAVAEGVE